MKKHSIAASIALWMAGCAHVQSVGNTGGQAIQLDAKTLLDVRVEGVNARPTPEKFLAVPTWKEGEPMHRVLYGADGALLFAYDIGIQKGSGAYRLSLSPSGAGSTFAETREISVNSTGTVRVELMEEPATGRKVEDVFRLAPIETRLEFADPMAHLRGIHELIARHLHGD
jgi:hypothetical protein